LKLMRFGRIQIFKISLWKWDPSLSFRAIHGPTHTPFFLVFLTFMFMFRNILTGSWDSCLVLVYVTV
jgi:hypothetical protein